MNRLLITGASGFIGQHLVKRLLSWDVELLLLGRSNPGAVQSSGRRLTFLPCDFSDPDSFDRHHDALQSVDAVAHVGGGVMHSSDARGDDAVQNLLLNPEATAHLLKHLSSSVTSFCYTSTADVYGLPISVPMDESHPTKPVSYYGVSKLATEGLLNVYAERTGVPVSVLRLSHVYGPGDTSEKAIPRFISAVLGGNAPVVFGDGSDTRDYVYVEDVVEGILNSLVKRAKGTFNVGAGRAASVQGLATTILRLTESSLTPELRPRTSPATHICLNIERAREQLDYCPQVELEEGLRQTIAWFRRRQTPNWVDN